MEIGNNIDGNTTADSQGSYFTRHWRGDLDLATSYWINYLFFSLLLVLLGLLISIFSASTDSSVLALTVPIAWNVFTLFIFTPWVLVGLLRSASKHIAMHNIYFWANIVRIIVVIAAIRAVLILQNTTYPQIKAYYTLMSGTGNIPDYMIELDNNDTTLHIVGGINLGISDKVIDLIEHHPSIKTLHIESIGGLTREARRIAAIVDSRHLDTLVSGNCFSSCTYIFTSGEKRILSKGARLGFHRPIVAGVDEQDMDQYTIKDKKIFEDKGVEPSFIDKIFSTPNSEVLEVSTEELIRAGIVTSVISYHNNYWSKSKNELEVLLRLSGIQQHILEQNNTSTLETIYADFIKSAPIQYDETTLLDKVVINEYSMKYEYTILSNNPVSESKEKSSAITKSIFSDICNDMLSVYFLKRGVSFYFHYVNNKDKSTILAVEIKDCDNATKEAL